MFIEFWTEYKLHGFAYVNVFSIGGYGGTRSLQKYEYIWTEVLKARLLIHARFS